MNVIIKTLEVVGRSVGNVVGILYQAGRDTIEQVLRNILPFMAFISMVIQFINEKIFVSGVKPDDVVVIE